MQVAEQKHIVIPKDSAADANNSNRYISAQISGQQQDSNQVNDAAMTTGSIREKKEHALHGKQELRYKLSGFLTQVKIAPNALRATYLVAFVFAMIFCAFLTYFMSDIDWNDNLIKNKFGRNSPCIIFDYAPAIYFGPFLYAIVLVIMSFYVLCCGLRLHILYTQGMMTKKQYYTVMFMCFVEQMGVCFGSTAFAVNDEEIHLHTMAYIVLISVMCIGVWRNLWYATNFCPWFNRDSQRGKLIRYAAWVYVAVHTLSWVCHSGMLLTYLYGSDGVIDFVDTVLPSGVDNNVYALTLMMQIAFVFVAGKMDGYLETVDVELVFPEMLKKSNDSYIPTNSNEQQQYSTGYVSNDAVAVTAGTISEKKQHALHGKQELRYKLSGFLTQVKIVPNAFRSIYLVAWILVMIFCAFLTYTMSDIDWDDNIIKNKFGGNSPCLIFDYAPAIYFGPFLYSFVLVIMSFYIFCSGLRLHILYTQRIMTKKQYSVVMFVCFAEQMGACFGSTAFAVNDEEIHLHTMAYIQLIWVLCFGAWRNLWYATNFCPWFNQNSQKGKIIRYSALTYCIVHTITLLCHSGMLLAYLYGSDGMIEFVDTVLPPGLDNIYVITLMLQIAFVFVAGKMDGYLTIVDVELVFPEMKE